MRRILAAVLFAAAVLAGCGQPAAPFAVSLVPAAAPAKAVIRITGFSSGELASLNSPAFDREHWLALMPVAVDGMVYGGITIAGQYRVTSSAVEFTPTFPFDAGRGYAVSIDPSKLPSPRREAPVNVVVRSAVESRTPSTTVTRMLPSSPVLPENLLRIYLEFSAPMSREHGRDFLTLIDERGHEVKDAFLALDVDFWSPDGRRYTAFLDPGRVKRGILPNDQLGRALKAGHKFTLVVDPKWRDANSQPLAQVFQHDFSVGPADMTPLQLKDWTIQSPASGARNALSVRFPNPLDHGLLQRALGVERDGKAVAGEIIVSTHEMEWLFVPKEPWVAGNYSLVVLSILEDPMGNRIGRSFDVDKFDQIDKTPAPDRMTLTFTVR